MIGPAVEIPEVHHHTEGDVSKIFVRTRRGTYVDTTANFADDWGGEAFPHLPERATDRVYRQGVVHCVQSADNVIEGGPMPWPLGDRIIAAFDQLAKRQTSRQEAEAQAKQKTEAQLAAEMGIPWPPRDILKELDALVKRVEALEAAAQNK